MRGGGGGGGGEKNKGRHSPVCGMCQAHSEGALFVEAQPASRGERSWSWMWRLPRLPPPVGTRRRN